MIPMAAVLLARRIHAPGLIVGGERPYNPKPTSISGLDDPSVLIGAEALEGFWELFGHWHRGLDFFCFSGLEIDEYGNVNVHYSRAEDGTRRRGPGVPNVSLGGSCAYTLLFLLEHSKRRLVGNVEFVSIPGHLSGPGARDAASLTGGGPRLCVTPLGVMDFEPESLRMRLRYTHPGVSVDRVLENTGFEMLVHPEVTGTPEPTAEEVRVLRSDVDPFGILRD